MYPHRSSVTQFASLSESPVATVYFTNRGLCAAGSSTRASPPRLVAIQSLPWLSTNRLRTMPGGTACPVGKVVKPFPEYLAIPPPSIPAARNPIQRLPCLSSQKEEISCEEASPSRSPNRRKRLVARSHFASGARLGPRKENQMSPRESSKIR